MGKWRDTRRCKYEIIFKHKYQYYIYYAQYIKIINIILVLRQAGKKKKRMTYSGHPFYSLMWERYFNVTEMT